MKKLLILLLIGTIFLTVSCEKGDPLPDTLYTSDIDISGDLYIEDSIIRHDDSGNGGYWHEHPINAYNLSVGASGATEIAPNVSSVGGFQLNSITEMLYFGIHINEDWDGQTDALLIIHFEVNDDNSAGNDADTIDFQLEAWHKQEGERVCATVDSLDSTTVVGKSQQHDMFITTIIIPNLRANEIINFRLNLNTVSSEVDDVIVNHMIFQYQTTTPSEEVD